MSENKIAWKSHVRSIIGIAIISLLICGLFFPLLITGIAQATMPYQANGDLAQVNGKTVGSYLIDNNFTLPIFFHARPFNDNSNGSASGVDPDINLTNAYDQIPRISNWTGISESDLFKIVNSNKQGTFWIFGSPYVDVLQLNIDLINSYPQVYQGYPKS